MLFRFQNHILFQISHPRYGCYGHDVRSPSSYDLIHSEYSDWSYSTRVSEAIKGEVDAARNDVALFDQTAFGKVRPLEGYAHM